MSETTTDTSTGSAVEDDQDPADVYARVAGEDADDGAGQDAAEDTEGDDELEDTTLESRNAEAARYRRRARDAETERDQLREQLVGLRRAEAERIAGEHVAKGSAIWAAGVQLEEVLDDDGRVDPERVAEAVRSARTALGLQPTPRMPKSDPSQGARGEVPSGPSIVEAFQPPHQRGRR